MPRVDCCPKHSAGASLDAACEGGVPTQGGYATVQVSAQVLQSENERLKSEAGHRKKEFARLKEENDRLKSVLRQIRGLSSDRSL